MVQRNIYKPRYKVAFQAKNKIWPYKSSRLRRFFNIRGRKIVRRGFFKRFVVVFNNMKWTIARRNIRPAMRRRRANRRRFRDAFYNKQQLRLFHGKIKEHSFRKIFQRFLIHGVNRNKTFFTVLERRIDVFFFRLRVFPTIFSCHQYIHHHGLLINNKLEHSPNALILPGDIVTVVSKHWKPIFWYIHDRLYYRVYGKHVALKRNFTLLKKKTWWIKRNFKRLRWVFGLRKKRLYFNLLIFKRRKLFLNVFIFILNLIMSSLSFKTKINISSNVFENFINKIFKELQKLLISYKQLYSFQDYSNVLMDIKITQVLWKKKKKRQKFLPFLGTKKKFFSVCKTKKALYGQWEKKSFFCLKRKQNLEKKSKVKKLFFYSKKKAFFYFKKKKRFLKKKFSPSKHFKFLGFFLGNLLSLYFKSYLFFFKLKKLELDLYEILFLYSRNEKSILKWKAYILLRRHLILRRYEILKKKVIRYYSFFLRKSLRKQKLKRFYTLRNKEKRRRKNVLTYFLINRKYKKNKRLRTVRLKKVHWAIPRYIYLDSRTLRGILLYAPLPKEIHYSFRCSLTKIASFYKSLGL